MKNFLRLISAGMLIMLLSPVSAQKFSKDKPITIENLAPDNVWQIVEKTLKEKEFGVGKFIPNENKLYSGWIEWTSIAIKNRGILLFTYESPILTLQMADRGYETKKGWEETIGSLSKKNYDEYLQSVADRITEINSSAAETKKAIQNSELIHAFKPVNTVGEITLTLLKTSSDKSKTTLEFSVKNNATYAVTIFLPVAEVAKNIKGIGSEYVETKFSRPADVANKAIFQPGETLGVTFEYGYEWQLTTMPFFHVRIMGTNVEGKWYELNMYQIPMNDYVFKPEEN